MLRAFGVKRRMRRSPSRMRIGTSTVDRMFSRSLLISADLLVASVELVVDGRQLLVGGLELFLGGLQLLVHALKLFVARDELLVGRVEVVVGAVLVVDERLQVFLGRRQLVLELGDPPSLSRPTVRVGGRPSASFAVLGRSGVSSNSTTKSCSFASGSAANGHDDEVAGLGDARPGRPRRPWS